MNLTPKEQAEQHRKIADNLDGVAASCDALGLDLMAYVSRTNATEFRTSADEIDPPTPPQPEWREGDLVRDRFGGLWQFDGSKWHLRCMERSTASLIRDFGPIRKVHIADPARHEVVVSLDGLDRDFIDKGWGDLREEDIYQSTSGKLASRAAKAARKQLGEVQ